MNKVFPDYGYTVLLMVIIAVGGVLYVGRVLTRGAASYARTEKIGGSVVLAKGVLDWWYWTMQPIARAMATVGLTANGVSWMSFGFGVLAAIAMAEGRFGLGMMFGVFGCLCDAIDGMVARIRGESSDAGEVLDAAIDRYTEFFFLGGLLIHYRDNVYILIITLLALLGSFMISYSTAKAEAMQVEPPRGTMRRHERAAYLLAAAGLSSLSIPFLEVPPRFATPVGIPMIVGLAIVALVSNVSAVRRFITIGQRVRAKELARSRAAAAPSVASAENADIAHESQTASLDGAE